MVTIKLICDAIPLLHPVAEFLGQQGMNVYGETVGGVYPIGHRSGCAARAHARSGDWRSTIRCHRQQSFNNGTCDKRTVLPEIINE